MSTTAEAKGMKTVTRFSGEKLRLLRELAGLTQVDMARKVRYRSSSDISRIESGEQVPRPRKIKALAKILNVPPGDLFAEIPQEAVTESK